MPADSKESALQPDAALDLPASLPRPSWVATLLTILDKTGDFVERHPKSLALALLVLYVAACANSDHRPLWYDELVTNLLAEVRGGLTKFVDVRFLLQHGALSVLLVRISTGIFGFGNWAFRLPASLGYLAASAFLLTFLRRARVGILFSLFAVVLFWLTPSFYYATEARPYGMILGFAGLLLVVWQRAVKPHRSVWSLAMIVLSEVALILCHPLAILAALLPIFFAEATRFSLRRKSDWPLWLCAGWPLLGVFGVFLGRPVHPVFSPILNGSLGNALGFYAEIVHLVALPLLCAACAGLIFATRAITHDQNHPTIQSQLPEIALIFGVLTIPFAVNLILAVAKTYPYSPRYGISGTLAVPLLAAMFFARTSGNSRRAGLLAAVAALFFFVNAQRHEPLDVWTSPPLASSSLLKASADLPVVVGSGLTFVEMGHREPKQFLARVFYLRDREGAMRYAHSEIFETDDFPAYAKLVPPSGTISPYANFIRTHPKFLVYGTVGYWEDWLLRRLMKEGAQVVWLGQVRGNYKDNDLYEVTITPEALSKAY